MTGTETRTAMVIDDELAIRELLEEVLGEAGFTTTSFAYGQPALDAIYKQHYDLLVVDIGLPDMNGLHICSAARDHYGERVAILIITADARKQRVISSFALGADDFVGKPFDIDELLARIDVHLRRTLGTSATH
jgi:DNA-binding response OmpR family regulator